MMKQHSFPASLRPLGTDCKRSGLDPTISPKSERAEQAPVVIQGLINVHTHAATGLFRGLADDKRSGSGRHTFRRRGQERFGIEDYSASLCAVCAESLLNGVTCIADHLDGMDLLAQRYCNGSC
jgi:cytosine/adenosine deaminase-related metal-dependent hydrolase